MSRIKNGSVMWNVPNVAINSPSEYPAELAAAWNSHLAERELDAPTVISTFAGIGGSALGYSMAGFRDLLAVEWDQHVATVFRNNFPDTPLHIGNIAELSVSSIFESTGLKKGDLDLFDGSPPCQGFSLRSSKATVSRTHKLLHDPRNQLFREYVRLLDGLLPKVFVVENVPAMALTVMKSLFKEIIETLREVGYSVKVRVMNAAFYRVPQQRRRIIIIGIRNDFNIKPSYPSPCKNPVLLWEALYGIDRNAEDREILLPPRQRVMWEKLQRGEGGAKYLARGFRRLAWNRVSSTLITSGGHTVVHPDIPHRMTVRELARIFSFPDGFKLPESYSRAHGGLGNCVPPFLIQAIALHLREVFFDRILKKT